MNKIIVTGGNGCFGSQVVIDLVKKGYDVVVLDRKEGSDSQQHNKKVQSMTVDLNNYQEVEQAMSGGDAVIHLAAILDARSEVAPQVFSNNVTSTYNILEAAFNLGYRKAVIASSESAYGFPFANHPLSPLYFPVDEQHPLIPEDSYGTSKAVNELTAESFFRRNGMQVVSLRLSSICTPAAYRMFYSLFENPLEMKRVLWSYVDIRDASAASILAVERNDLGSISLNIASDDTFMNIKSQELIERFFPKITDIRVPFNGFEALYSNAKAKELLGWEVRYNWRDEVQKLQV